MAKRGNKYLLFYTSHEQFAININDIVIIEKVEYEKNQKEKQWIDKRIKRVKSYPDFIEGVYTFKHKIIPVVEFEYFLSNTPMYRHEENKIIIVKGKDIQYGILVNDVHSIVELDPNTFIQLYRDYPIYMTEKDGEVIIVPDLHVMMNNTDINKIFQAIRGNVQAILKGDIPNH